MEMDASFSILFESISMFLNSKSPTIFEWKLVIHIISKMVPRLIFKDRLISITQKEYSHETIESDAEYIISQILLNFDELCKNWFN